jgi:ribonuclease R
VHAAPDPEREGGFVVTSRSPTSPITSGPGSELDREAQKRGNSVYFPGRVVPMLPERISNDLCSLREGEDRPAMAVRMRLEAGRPRRHHSFHSVMMRSAAKLSYQQAQAAIDGQPDEKAGPLLEPILKAAVGGLRVLGKGPRRTRAAGHRPAGAQGPAEGGRLRRPHLRAAALDAHRLIEEFMIQANVCAAESLEAKRSPVVYRIHDEPSWDKLESLREFPGLTDMSFPKAGSLRPSQFNECSTREPTRRTRPWSTRWCCARRARRFMRSRTSAILA